MRYEFRKERERLEEINKEAVNKAKPYLGKWLPKKRGYGQETTEGSLTISMSEQFQPMVLGKFMYRRVENQGEKSEKILTIEGEFKNPCPNESTPNTFSYLGTLHYSVEYTNKRWSYNNGKNSIGDHSIYDLRLYSPSMDYQGIEILGLYFKYYNVNIGKEGKDVSENQSFVRVN